MNGGFGFAPAFEGATEGGKTGGDMVGLRGNPMGVGSLIVVWFSEPPSLRSSSPAPTPGATVAGTAPRTPTAAASAVAAVAAATAGRPARAACSSSSSRRRLLPRPPTHGPPSTIHGQALSTCGLVLSLP